MTIFTNMPLQLYQIWALCLRKALGEKSKVDSGQVNNRGRGLLGPSFLDQVIRISKQRNKSKVPGGS
jgi:hypothetical protein